MTTIPPFRGTSTWRVLALLATTRLATALLATVLLGAGSARAQSGSLIGNVTRGCEGTPLVGADVTVGGVAVAAAADEEGYYEIVLPVGTYSVTAAISGYESLTIAGIVVTGGQRVRQNFGLAPSGQPLCYLVSANAEGGSNSLHQAIQITNSVSYSAQPDEIHFDLPQDQTHLKLTAALPAITGPVVIDGSTQQGARCGPPIASRYLPVVIDGSDLPSTLTVAGLHLWTGSDFSVIRGIHIRGFSQDGIRIEGSSNNTIQCSTIGDPIQGATNSGSGIFVSNASSNVIGGTLPGNSNVISGNGTDGILITGIGAVDNVVAGNYIGTDASGQLQQGNNRSGIRLLAGANGTRIGDAAAPNVIAFNALEGIGVGSSSELGTYSAIENDLRGNNVFGNGALGIDLAVADGPPESRVTPNDAGDADVGPNRLVNFPELASTSFTGRVVTIGGTLQTVDGTYTVEFYSNRSCDGTGYGEGSTILGATTVTVSDGSGAFTESFTLPHPDEVLISATATDADGNTSEYSKCMAPSIQVASGYVFEIFADGLDAPQGMAVDASGDVYVTAAGSGEIYRYDSSGNLTAPIPFASGFSRPVDVELFEGDLFVSDVDLDGIYRIDPSGVGTTIDGRTLTPIVSGLGGPTFITAVPSLDALLVSVGRDAANDRVVKIELVDGTAFASSYVAFSGDSNPQGITSDADGNIYLATQSTGEVVRIPAGAVPPFDGDALSRSLSGLESPVGIASGIDRRLLVATPDGVLSGSPGSVLLQPFVTPLSGADFNNVVATADGQVFVADGAAGRIIRVVLPADQVVPADNLTFQINAAGAASITDGSDLLAVQNAFLHWESITEAGVRFSYAGEASETRASARDGVNLVTFRDTDFLFPPLVLAVAAKTIELGDAPGTARIVDADIVYNPVFDRANGLHLSTSGGTGSFDVESVATHEVGHVLGLVHSGVPDATMFFVLQAGTEARSLTPDDRAWAGSRYPSSTFASTHGSISGRIDDGERPGHVVAGALVVATNPLTRDAVHAYSDQAGNYEIPGLAAGDYEVSVQPLDGDVFGFPMVPGAVSPYLQAISNNRTFQEEKFNGTDESSNPDVDDPDSASPVSVMAGTATTAIDLVTNLDLTPPSVVTISPVDGASDVPVDIAEIVIGFSEAVDLNTIDVSLAANARPVGGTLTLINGDKVALFTPNRFLDAASSYSIRIEAGLQDRSPNGNPTSAPFTSTFTTEPPDAASPTVVQVTPGPTGAVVTENVIATFSEAVDPSTVTPSSFRVTDEFGEALEGTVFVDPALHDEVASFDPAEPLREASTYTVTLTTAISDRSGNTLAAEFNDVFTTVPVTPLTAAVRPLHGASGIAVTSPVLADFSKPIDPTSISTSTFSVAGPGGSVAGTFELLLLNSRAVFRPSAPLQFSTTYTLTLTAGVTDLTGQSLPPQTTMFTTADAATRPSILAVSPPAGVIGTTITLSGGGIDPNPDNVTVRFTAEEGTVTGTVSRSTLTSASTTIPPGAVTGPLTIEVDGVTSSNAFPFGVITFDPLIDAAVARVTAEGGSRGADITPDGTTAYVTNRTAHSVSIIDLVRTRSVGSVPVGLEPLKVAITPDGSRAYVTNFKSHTVSVIDIATNTVTETIPVGLNPYGVAVSPDGSHVYVAEFTAKGVTVIDADPTSGAFNRATARVSTESGNRSVELSPDGTLAFITGTAGVTIIDVDPASPAYNHAIARVSSESGTKGVELSPDGTLAFVSVDDGSILVIDVNRSGSSPFQVIARTSSEGGANEVELSPDGTVLFATNTADDVVAVFEISYSTGSTFDAETANGTVGVGITLTRVATIALAGGLDPEDIVFSPSTGIAVVANSGTGDVSILDFSGTVAEVGAMLALGERIDEIVGDGGMTRGQGDALKNHVNRAVEWHGRDRVASSIRHLTRFKKQVAAYRDLDENDGEGDGGDSARVRLDPAVAAELLASTDAILEMLGGEPAAPETAVSAVTSLRDDLEWFVGAGRLDREKAQSLTSPLSSALGRLEDHNVRGATRDLGRFVTAVRKLVREDALSEEDAAALADEGEWIVEALNSDEAFAGTDGSSNVPTRYTFSQNYPNPFSRTTAIPFDVAGGTGADVRLEVYDLLGRRIATLMDEFKEPGHYEVIWNGRSSGGADVTSGIYFIRLQAGPLDQVRKAIVVR